MQRKFNRELGTKGFLLGKEDVAKFGNFLGDQGKPTKRAFVELFLTI